MKKIIDLSKNVHDLAEEFPELPEIMAEIGFTEMTKKVALNSVGRIMTIPKGCEIKNIELPLVLRTLREHGFEVTGAELPEDAAADSKTKDGAVTDTNSDALTEASRNSENRTSAAKVQPANEQHSGNAEKEGTFDAEPETPEERGILLKSYVQRLSEGEDLETVREEFVRHFRNVDAAEIAKAEQSLIEGGAKITDVQRLCDVHSALFHGATKQEQLENAEKAVQESLTRERSGKDDAKSSAENKAQSQTVQGKPAELHRTDGGDKEYQKLREIAGHPLQIFYLENRAIEKQLQEMRTAAEEGTNIPETLEKTRQIAVHYAKKGDLLYPVLKKDYGFSGPSDVMWGVDDEIRDELKKLAGEIAGNADRIHEADWEERLDKVLTRAEEMVYKEDNILFPLTAKLFSEKVWKDVARDMGDYEFCLIEPVALWSEASGTENPAGGAGEIVLPSGSFTAAQLEALLNTIPLEITFIDEHEINRYFNQNEGSKLFKRPLAALGREVYTCHPPKVEPMVRMVISELKSGKRNSFDVWNERAGEPVLIRYMAVRSVTGEYLGTMEIVQHMGFAKEHFAGTQK